MSLHQAAEAAHAALAANTMHIDRLMAQRKLRAALDAPDITDELATALRDLLRYHDACGVESGTGDAARAVLRRYDDSRRSIDSANAD